MKNDSRKLTLDRPVVYKITVPGVLDEKVLDWNGGVQINIEGVFEDEVTTTLTTTVDQAGLQGLLRYLYSLGLPIISVIYSDFSQVKAS